jgi:protein-S-isoprenylcysteine O-methyltransferase Ste14
LDYILIILALILIAQHWLSAIIGIPMTVLVYIGMREEERSNIEKFGDAYKRYIQSVPRMNLLVGVIKLVRRRKRGWK